MKIERIQRPAHPGEITPVNPVRKQQIVKKPFTDLLKARLNESTSPVKFSAHATERLLSRNITLTEQDLARLSDGVRKLEEKGGTESLMLMGDLTFVVSVKNRTVITAMEKDPSASEKIFTNIDSALIM